MIVDRYAKDPFGAFLPDDVLIQIRLEFLRQWNAVQFDGAAAAAAAVLFQDAVAQLDALVADIDARRAGDQAFDLIVAAGAERALLIQVCMTGHCLIPQLRRRPVSVAPSER